MKLRSETKGCVRFHSETKRCFKIFYETEGRVIFQSDTKVCMKVCPETKRCLGFALRQRGA